MAISQPQQYCLRWNNHQHNLLSVFEDLLNHEAFVDVTLACEGLNLKAHKMVLSACSPYFHSMFYNTPDKHPVVFLKDVRYEEMKALLEFMYRGEVSVDQENLSSLLKVAEGLKIKGLADVNESHGGIPGPRLSLPLPNPAPHLPMYHGSLMSPEQSLKRLQASSSPHGFLGPKRKRGRPRRLSGAESIPLAVNLSEESMGEETSSPLHHIPSPHHHPSPLSHPSPLQHTTPHHQPPQEDSSHPSHPSSNLPDTMENEQSPVKSLKEGTGAMSLSPGDLKVSDFPSEAESNDGRSSGLLKSPPVKTKEEKGSKNSRSNRPNPSPSGTRGNLSSQPGPDSESLSDMSVRGLDLLKYAQISPDGSYRCLECEKMQIVKSFKNKYSFQRHAFLYHEGKQRKVFPCPVCLKEFSRPDKMKQHLKQVHDCIIPKSEATPPPAHFLINPYLTLEDHTVMEAKVAESGNEMFKLMSRLVGQGHLNSTGGQGAS